MPVFSEKSQLLLSTCHQDLQKLCHDVIKVFDFTVLQGHRSQEEHRLLVQQGRSKVPYSRSKHRFSPSNAIDIAPYPINWQDRERFFISLAQCSSSQHNTTSHCDGVATGIRILFLPIRVLMIWCILSWCNACQVGLLKSGCPISRLSF